MGCDNHKLIEDICPERMRFRCATQKSTLSEKRGWTEMYNYTHSARGWRLLIYVHISKNSPHIQIHFQSRAVIMVYVVAKWLIASQHLNAL